jgi:hypothetical protein
MWGASSRQFRFHSMMAVDQQSPTLLGSILDLSANRSSDRYGRKQRCSQYSGAHTHG